MKMALIDNPPDLSFQAYRLDQRHAAEHKDLRGVKSELLGAPRLLPGGYAGAGPRRNERTAPGQWVWMTRSASRILLAVVDVEGPLRPVQPARPPVRRPSPAGGAAPVTQMGDANLVIRHGRFHQT